MGGRERPLYAAVAFVDVAAVEGYTLRPAACRMNRPDLIERGPAAHVAYGFLRLVRPAVSHLSVLPAVSTSAAPCIRASLWSKVCRGAAFARLLALSIIRSENPTPPRR